MNATYIFLICQLLTGLTTQNLLDDLNNQKAPKDCNQLWAYKKTTTSANQTQFYDQCHCEETFNVRSSILDSTSTRACMINNTAKDDVTGLSFCELTARFNMCPKIKKTDCEGSFKKINGRCTGPLNCKTTEHNSNGHCCAKALTWSAKMKKCLKTSCPDGQTLKNGICVQSACPKFQIRVKGKCELRCAKGKELYPKTKSVGCAPVCKKGEHVENGTCSPNWVGCRTKSECQKYFVTKIKASKLKKMTAEENLRSHTTAKHRRNQALVPKVSDASLEDAYAAYWKELDFFMAQIRLCKDTSKCGVNKTCSKAKCVCQEGFMEGYGTCSSICKEGYKWAKGNLCQNKCKDSELYNTKTKKCDARCKQPLHWNAKTKSCQKTCAAGTKFNTDTMKCDELCKAEQKWDVKTNKCVNRCNTPLEWNVQAKRCSPVCPAEQQLDAKTNKCVDRCKPEQQWVVKTNKCADKCKADEKWDATAKKCLNRCKAPLKWDAKSKICSPNCPAEQELSAKTNKCADRCKADEKWDATAKKCVDKCTPEQSWDLKTKKCKDRCTAAQTQDAKTKKCKNRCPADLKWDAKTKKCVDNRCTEAQTYDAKTNKCKNRCTANQKWDAKTNKCVDRCTDTEKFNPKTNECDKTECSKGQILVEGQCFVDIRIEVPMGDYWRKNRETEDMELMMEEFKRTAVFYGNRIDSRVHRLIVRAQAYLARLKTAHTVAAETHKKGEKVVKIWTLISKPIQKKVLRRLQHAKTHMAIHKIHNHLNSNEEYQGIVKQVNSSWENPGPAVKVMPAVDDYQKRLDNRVDLLSQIVTKIQDAYDQAKVNNNKAKTLLLDEMKTRTQAYAAKKVLMDQRRFTSKTRKSKALNFPPLPKDMTMPK